MNLCLSNIAGSKKGGELEPFVQSYVRRGGRYVGFERRIFGSERQVLEFVEGVGGRTRAIFVLLDVAGKAVSSEDLARFVGECRDGGTQHLIFAVGAADGWTADARARADHAISFGKITLPHELATLVAAEQLYRALTILAGHPYHGGH
ncbi:MAG: 23S rRNA (pseudouridine(1915)-N(3))-methyltransferase RlmH [Acidobacteria bacterium]|nr:23S rRNA (pseudouridine(1915)-N(3))-methyltransferase RlmH [Acidobacteriota bacterium]